MGLKDLEKFKNPIILVETKITPLGTSWIPLEILVLTSDLSDSVPIFEP